MTDKKLSRAERWAKMLKKHEKQHANPPSFFVKGPGKIASIDNYGWLQFHTMASISGKDALALRDWLSATYEPSEGGE